MIVKKFKRNKKKHQLHGHFYRPFVNLEQLLRKKGLYPKEKKLS